MGDYCKLIVSCTVSGAAEEELKTKVKELGMCVSAYQSQERIEFIEKNEWPSRGDLQVVLVGQTKYGRGQDEFCDWLRPHVTQGSGENEVFAISFSEYGDEPRLWKKHEENLT